MAFTTSNLGTNNGAAVTTLAVTCTADTQSGDWILVAVAADNTQTLGNSRIDSCADEDGTFYLKLAHAIRDPGAADAGVSAMWFGRPVTSDVDTVTVTFNASVNHAAMAVYRLRPDGGEYIVPLTSTFADGGSATTHTLSAVSVTSGDTIFGAMALESDDAITADSDTTNGSWSAVQGDLSDTGADAAACRLVSQWKTVTGTGNQTYNTSVGVACDWCGVGVVMHPATGSEPTVPFTRLGQATIDTSATAVAFGSVTPADNSLLVACAWLLDDVADLTSLVTISDSLSGVWTLRESVGATTDGHHHLYCWTRPVTTGASMTISANWSGGALLTKHLQIWVATSYDSSSPIGGTGNASAASVTTGDVTLSSTPAASSLIFGFRGLATQDNEIAAAVPHIGWYEYSTPTSDDRGNLCGEVGTNWTSTTVDWTRVSAAGATTTMVSALAIEVKAAPAAGQPYRKRLGGVKFTPMHGVF